MNRRTFLTLTGGALFAAPAPQKPNIIVIYADDVGYGDLGCYGATRVKTPNLDRLAAQGLRFTNAHSVAATCTPSRYSLLTGEYAWRKKGTGVLPGDANAIILPGRHTIASVLQQAGYTTGVVGKWHLGLGAGKVNWNTEIKPGPREIGFDYSFLIPATGDRVPCVYVENQRVVGLDPKDPIEVSYSEPIGNEPTGRDHPELLKMKYSHGHDQTIVNGISRIGYMTGGKAARWKDEDIADTITAKAVSFIERSKAKPFFLYFATHDVHVPRVPHERFRGKSGCGVRCDAMQQLDWCVGEILKTVERLKLDNNTLILFTSDNGPVLDDGYEDRAIEDLNGHSPAGPFRGGKYTLYEGGTRMPFLVRWPRRIRPGASHALISQVDLLATFAALVGQPLPSDAGPDSFNLLPALLGEDRRGREYLIEQANGIGIRTAKWKCVPHYPAPARKAGPNHGIPRSEDRWAGASGPELYDLEADVAEKNNVAAKHPKVVEELTAMIQKVRSNPRSRP
jgi:arylsulfatase A-like enzyme